MESLQLSNIYISYPLIALWLFYLSYIDIKTKEIGDHLYIPLVATILFFAPKPIEQTFLLIAQSLGVTYILKYILENIALNLSYSKSPDPKKNQSQEKPLLCSVDSKGSQNPPTFSKAKSHTTFAVSKSPTPTPTIGEADIILIGILSSLFSFVEYGIFLLFILIFFLLHMSIKMIQEKTNHISVKVAFIPYISASFIFTSILYLYII